MKPEGRVGHAHQKTNRIELLNKLLSPLEPVPTGTSCNISPCHPKAIIFDIYGTLLISAAGDVGPDSAEDDEQAFVQALSDGGWTVAALKEPGTKLLQEEIAKEHLHKKEKNIKFPEIDILQIWQQVLSRLGLVTEAEHDLTTAVLSYECRTNPVWLMPGLVEVLTELKARGIRLGILSNAQFYTPLLFEFLCGQSLSELGFEQDLCLFSYREGEGKPSPNLFARLAARLEEKGIAAGEVLYVGNDMLKDIWPAQAVGWQTALFAGDKRSLRLRQDDPRVMEVQPDLIIDDLGQLLMSISPLPAKG
jgi:putative hydrolase of the HAD superfamily